MADGRKQRAMITAALFVVAFTGFAFLFLRFSILYDSDSYMHLAIARLYAAHGLAVHGLPWTRFSVMHEGFGDKELLFHLALAPFTALTDAAVGGRLALALLNAAIVAAIAWLGMIAIGRWGLTLPFLAYLTSTPLLPRMVRLRPELLALLLLLAAIYLAATRRYRALGVVALLFALSYTAFHVLFGLVVLWAIHDRLRDGTWNRRLLLYPSAGFLVGIVIHPQFPKNLQVWWIQNVLFFFEKGSLGVGGEIFGPTAAAFVWGNAGFILALAALWLASRPREGGARPDDRLGPYFAISAAVFIVLYVFMARMITYAAPLAILALAFAIRAASREIDPIIRAGRVRLPLAAVFGIAVIVSLPRLADPMLLTLLRDDPSLVAEGELERFGKAMPAGAKVAATWEATELYAFWAPQATYLNMFDPIFMAHPHPGAFELQRRLFGGMEPDTPLTAVWQLDSNVLAFDRGLSSGLLDRIVADPRVQPVYASFNVIARIREGANAPFVLDWHVLPPNTEPATAATAPLDSLQRYPRMKDARLRSIEGFVNLERVTRGPGCVTFASEMTTSAPAKSEYEFAPWGPGSLWLDGRPIVIARGSIRAILGKGVRVPIDLAPGTHRFVVQTCTDESLAGGFYLRRIEN